MKLLIDCSNHLPFFSTSNAVYSMNTKILVCITSLLGCAAAVSAQSTIVSFTGNSQIMGNVALGGVDSLLVPGSSISPAAPDYTGQAFSGGVRATNTTVGTWQIESVIRGGPNMSAQNWISALTASTEGAAAKFHRGVIFFEQANFLEYNTLPGGVGLQSLAVAVTRSSGNPSRFGFVIQADGAYFLSEPVTYSQTSGTGFDPFFVNGHYLSIADAADATWLSFDPEVSYSAIGGAANPDLSRVTGVGIWFENERAGGSNLGLGFHVTGIEITAIPEPSTYAMLFGLFTLGFVAWRRRKTA